VKPERTEALRQLAFSALILGGAALLAWALLDLVGYPRFLVSLL
jgi:hypothetical protein